MQGEDLTPENPDASTEPAAPVEPAGQDAHVAEATSAEAPLDLDAIQQDLADVEVALARLDAGTYWTDEVTGEALPAELLAEHPTARRA